MPSAGRRLPFQPSRPSAASQAKGRGRVNQRARKGADTPSGGTDSGPQTTFQLPGHAHVLPAPIPDQVVSNGGADAWPLVPPGHADSWNNWLAGLGIGPDTSGIDPMRDMALSVLDSQVYNFDGPPVNQPHSHSHSHSHPQPQSQPQVHPNSDPNPQPQSHRAISHSGGATAECQNGYGYGMVPSAVSQGFDEETNTATPASQNSTSNLPQNAGTTEVAQISSMLATLQAEIDGATAGQTLPQLSTAARAVSLMASMMGEEAKVLTARPPHVTILLFSISFQVIASISQISKAAHANPSKSASAIPELKNFTSSLSPGELQSILRTLVGAQLRVIDETMENMYNVALIHHEGSSPCLVREMAERARGMIVDLKGEVTTSS